MFRLVLLGVFINFLVGSASRKKLEMKSEAQMDIVKSLNAILKDNLELEGKDLHLSVWFNKGDSENSNHLKDLSDEILKNGQNRRVLVGFESPVTFQSTEHYQLILVDTFDSMKKIYSNMRRTRNLSYTLVYLSTVRSIHDAAIRKALQLCWELHILNVGIIITDKRNSSTEIVMLTSHPYAPRKCEIIEAEISNRFERLNGSWQSRDYFPEKSRNFFGCPLTSATWEGLPYMKVERNSHGQISQMKGIEGHLVQFIAKNLNFTVDLHPLSIEERSQIFNDSTTIFQKLFDSRVKFALGAFRYRSERIHSAPFSKSNYYFISNIHLVVNNIDQHEWYKTLLRPLQPQVWLLIGLAFSFGFVVIFTSGHRSELAGCNAFVIGHGRKKSATPFYNMFVTFLGGPTAHPLPKRNFARYILMLWTLSTLVLRGAYQSGLYAILRDQRDDEVPNRLSQVAQRELAIEIIPENSWFLSSLPEVKHVRFLSTNELQEFPVLAAETTRRIGVLTPYEYFGYFRKVNATLSRRLSLVKERIFALPLCVFLPKDSFLLPLLNEQILWAQNYGFIIKWKNNYMEERKEKELGNGRATAVVKDDSPEAEINVLSMRELGAIFPLLVYLLLIACGFFVGELATFKLTVRGRKLK